MYHLRIATKAQKEIRRIKKIHLQEVQEAIQNIKEDPSIGKPLGEDLLNRFSYRIRVYRIIYKVNEKDKIISIISAGHRSTVYN